MLNNVLFSLASNKLEDDDKSRIAARLMSLPRPDKIKFGYPAFPKLSDKSLTKNSKERSKIYQVVEAERRAKPDAKKKTLN